MLGADDAGDAQLDLVEVIDADETRGGSGFHGFLLVLGVTLRGMGLRRRLQAFLVGFDQRGNLFCINAGHQVPVWIDTCW